MEINIKGELSNKYPQFYDNRTMEKLDTPPSIFEVIMQGEENENLEDIIPMVFPNELPTIPSCVREDLENICRDCGRRNRIHLRRQPNNTIKCSYTHIRRIFKLFRKA